MRTFIPLLIISLLIISSTLAASQSPNAQPKNGGDFSNNIQSAAKLPKDVILVKGAWSSASDSVTPVPEGGTIANNIFSDPYFGVTYALPEDWAEKYKDPPPSDTGRYVLAEIRPAATFKGPARGTILITAQDMFFTPIPGNNALELVNYSKDHLQADYKIEMPPTPTKINDHPFTFFAYWSPVAELHWYVLSTEIRCHAIDIILTSRDTKMLESLVLDLNKMKLPAEAGPTAGTGGGDVPVCIKNYASDANVTARVDPIFTDHKFNPVPVRIIIDKEGKVKHIHFLSAFPDQAKAITDAMAQWRFKPYRRNGQPVEVETGIMFGRAQFPQSHSTAATATE
jgi:Gram-negative bacterial TonB protein C-terminal